MLSNIDKAIKLKKFVERSVNTGESGKQAIVTDSKLTREEESRKCERDTGCTSVVWCKEAGNIDLPPEAGSVSL